MTEVHTHKALQSGNSAVITGAASGIGLATARQMLERGINVVVADNNEEALANAETLLRDSVRDGAEVRTHVCDVSDEDQMQRLEAFACKAFGDISILFCNAGIAMNPGKPWENTDRWRALLDINLWGMIYGAGAFVPHMIEHGKPGLIINTGSKQGITRPPGNAAYNMSKAGVIAFTESLAHEFRQLEDCQLSAHLLVPGFTYTGMISQFVPEKPAAAWTSDQVVDYMLARLEKDDFYIVCPDNDVSEEMDAGRVQWYADDVIKNRPALSRWHKDYAESFEAFMKQYKR